MNRYELIDAINLVDDDLLEEAEKYGTENISAASEKKNRQVKKNNIYYLISTAAACAALCLAVNHFTSSDNNSEGPEIYNNDVTTPAVTSLSEPEQSVSASAFLTNVSTAVQPVSSDTLQSGEMTISSVSEDITSEETQYAVTYQNQETVKPQESGYEYSETSEVPVSRPVSEYVPGTVYTTENEPVSSVSVTEETEQSDVTTEDVTDSEPHITEGAASPFDIPVHLLVYAEYNNKLYKTFGYKCRPQDSEIGEEVTAAFKTGLYDDYPSSRSACKHSGEYSDTVLFLKIPGEDYYYLFYDFDLSINEYRSILENILYVE